MQKISGYYTINEKVSMKCDLVTNVGNCFTLILRPVGEVAQPFTKGTDLQTQQR